GRLHTLQHYPDDEPVDGNPRLSDLWRELWTEASFQCPQQCVCHRVEMASRDAVRGVPTPECTQRGHDRIEVVETGNGRGQHLHQLAALGLEITDEQGSKRGVQVEKPFVKQRRGVLCDGHHESKAVLHKGLLIGSHLAQHAVEAPSRTSVAITEPDLVK